MPSARRNVALNVYVGSVVAFGAVALGLSLADVDFHHLAGPDVRAFLLFAILLALGEVRPLEWLSGREGGEITASWTFSLGLLCLAPTGVVLAFVALVGGVLESRSRKPLRRVLFNVAQVTLSLTAGAAVLGVVGSYDVLWNPSGPNASWVVAVLAAGLTALLTNGALTCVVLALSHELPVREVIGDAVSSDWALDLLLIVMTPVLVVVSIRSFVVVPMLLIVIVGVYLSAKTGLNHRYEATHDLLTGLPNRRMFFHEAELSLKAAEYRERIVGILVIDLDGFKEINDRLGHAVGDLALRHVATRLLAHRGSSDVVARLGGDEFVFLLGGVGDADAAMATAAAIAQSLRQPLEIGGVPLIVSGSVGLALYPDHGEDVDAVLAHADVAMYEAKVGRVGVRLYDGLLDRNGPTRMGLLSELGRAVIDDQQLFLAYQPKIDLSTNTICGVEALIRWNHPTRGHLAAVHFMPVAEQTELIDDITTLVLRQAISQGATWLRQGINLPIAVNVSARNLMQYRFPELVGELLTELGLPAHLLEIEITENTVTSDPARGEVILKKLKALGVHLSIDDFGTGYSSLAHLRSLPLDVIKIDRSFIKDICSSAGDQVIVRCIIDLATNLDLVVVAEGVEDAETLTMLRKMGCTVAQGYYLGMPGTIAEVEHQLIARQLINRAELTAEVEP